MREMVHSVEVVGHEEVAPRVVRQARLPLDALTVTLFVVGLVPLFGYAWRHAWDSRELGLAAAMVVLSGRELVRYAVGLLRRAHRAER
ncbi:hypothetical protein [Anaeromyxobacter oryzae]|uniref:Uncharacterized protein n=1 Tax=Anaeromyxobacter oryzae TaxID=2918170 RepID=A0ABN6MV63_9BACT|nr:hypothetical protein [Anaeromyxobacter oryzae]BDG04150.1 hypothetical protein AMOR_31460 [Anaeromyxobacter oryzae]